MGGAIAELPSARQSAADIRECGKEMCKPEGLTGIASSAFFCADEAMPLPGNFPYRKAASKFEKKYSAVCEQGTCTFLTVQSFLHMS